MVHARFEVARTTRCPGARSAQEAAKMLMPNPNFVISGRLLVAFGHPDNKLSGLPDLCDEYFILL
jgi:hypothetical protein